MIPACFSSPSTPSTPTHVPHNLVTSTYQTQLCNSPTLLTLTWSKTLLSHSLTISAPDFFSTTISLFPPTFSFFRTRNLMGSKPIRHCQKLKLHWDFTRADFARDSAEPESRFYVAVSRNAKLEFFLGDLQTELTRRPAEPTLVARREHVFGRRRYVSRAEFLGAKHEIGIECSGGVLKVKVDGEIRLVVKRLGWKFRGNERILVGGTEVEFFWDVFNWVKNNTSSATNGGGGGGGGGGGHGVFVFQVGDGGVCPEMVGAEKRLMKKSILPIPTASVPSVMLSPSPSCSSVLQWAEESSDGGRSSCCSSTKSSGSNNGGFSLLLYAWRKE